MALTRPPLSLFALHFAKLNGYLDSGFLVRIPTQLYTQIQSVLFTQNGRCLNSFFLTRNKHNKHNITVVELQEPNP